MRDPIDFTMDGRRAYPTPDVEWLIEEKPGDARANALVRPGQRMRVSHASKPDASSTFCGKSKAGLESTGDTRCTFLVCAACDRYDERDVFSDVDE